MYAPLKSSLRYRQGHKKHKESRLIYQKGKLHHTFESQPRLCPNKAIQHKLQQNTLFLNQAEEFTDNEIHKNKIKPITKKKEKL
jgi:hypothetical protein